GVMIDNGQLLITGSGGRDQLTVKVGSHLLFVRGTIGHTRINQTLTMSGVQQIVAQLGDGDDSLKIEGNPRIPIFVDAGGGNDSVTINAGSAILLGGDGNDRLFGGRMRDILIGGTGQDQLFGNAGQDILIGGTTSFDQNQAALLAIQAEWNARATLATRMNNLA